ncbi:MAG: N-acetyltransferase [Acidimicrobiia bacterium]|nr:N-acetyltransferase [Acidimicrobiia bacterium]
MAVEVRDAPERSRYEARVDGALVGFAVYQPGGNSLVFTHTEIDDAHEGQGVGSALARGALDDVRSRGLAVVARCPFVAGWIDRHPDYEELVQR